MAKKRHPWRLCPFGEHWVKAHPRRGTRGIRGHCRINPSRKDQIYSDELALIARARFDKLQGPPSAKKLGYSQGNKFDHLIRGWTAYWNDDPHQRLDPDLVKALIATESGFRATVAKRAGKRAGFARGLMQVTDWTLEILRDESGELSDHLVNVTQRDMMNPVFNVAAGIRWLFRKRETASAKLGRSATWDEAVAEYKAYSLKNPDHAQLRKFRGLHEELKK